MTLTMLETRIVHRLAFHTFAHLPSENYQPYRPHLTLRKKQAITAFEKGLGIVEELRAILDEEYVNFVKIMATHDNPQSNAMRDALRRKGFSPPAAISHPRPLPDLKSIRNRIINQDGSQEKSAARINRIIQRING